MASALTQDPEVTFLWQHTFFNLKGRKDPKQRNYQILVKGDGYYVLE